MEKINTIDLFENVIQELIRIENSLVQDRSSVAPIEIEDLQAVVTELEERYLNERGSK